MQLRDRQRAGKANWLRRLESKKWQIIRPCYNSSMARVEDVMACHEITQKLTKLGQIIRVTDDKSIIDNGSNIVIVCASKANIRSREISKSVKMSIYIDTSVFPNVIRDCDTGQAYTSPLDFGRKSDLAIFGRVEIPSANNCFFIWGLHGAGTLGAAKAFCSNNMLSDVWRQTSGKNFISIIQVKWDEIETMPEPAWLVPPRVI